jgi:hypothetical protein
VCMVLICMLLGIYYFIGLVPPSRGLLVSFRSFVRRCKSCAICAANVYESDRLMSTASRHVLLPPVFFCFHSENGTFIKRFCGVCYHLFTRSPPYNRRRKKQMTMTGQNGAKIGTDTVKQGLAQMLKGGVIVRITTNFFLDCTRHQNLH